jgi:hypothetical protein
VVIEGVLRWVATLQLFYQVLLAGAFLFGAVALLFGLSTGNPAFVAVAVFWLVVAPAAIRLSERSEADERG